MTFNTVDIVIVLILLVGLVAGIRMGLIRELAGNVAVVIALAVARAGYHPVRGAIIGVAPHAPWATAAAYLLTFLIIWGAILIAARGLQRVAYRLSLGPIDRLGGALLGLVQSALVVQLLLYLGERVHRPALTHAIRHSVLAHRLLHLTPIVHHLYPHIRV